MKIFNDTNYPRLEPHQFLVIQAEVWTGKILDLNGKIRDERDKSSWLMIFESLKEAEAFAENRINQFPDIECWIQSYDGLYKKRVFKKGYKRFSKKF